VQFAGEGFDWSQKEGADTKGGMLAKYRNGALYDPPALPAPDRKIAETPEAAADGVIPASAETPAAE
jgi:hypothetical protein